MDGWRDDKFPRKVPYFATSLQLLIEITERGMALAYLPDSIADKLRADVLLVEGCPYSCKQKIKLVAQNPKDVSWMARLFAGD